MIFEQKIHEAEKMVNTQLISRGILDQRLLFVMSCVPRDIFLRERKNTGSYRDNPVPIGYGQTMSQPYMVAVMTEKLLLTGREKVLEIGTGSGYQTAILAELADKVYTIERIPSLYNHTKKKLDSLGYSNIFCKLGDGSLGWEEYAPYDCIIVTAAAPALPGAYKNQIADNGLIVLPIGDYKSFQVLHIIKRTGRRFDIRKDLSCRFVPLIGEHGF
jgi:protein-L-isoaspartate(D-aspartate) O-methyltransferase